MTGTSPHPARAALVLTALVFSASVAPAAAQASFVTGAGPLGVRVTSMRDMPFRTVVRQQFDYSCGSAAVATLMRHHYGRPVTEAEVFRAMYARGDQAAIRRVGFSMLDMKTYLVASGLAADGYRLNIEHLAQLTGPAIALVRVGTYRHFVVLKGLGGGKVLVGDPALGLQVYELSEFARVWDGLLLKVHASAATGAFNQAHEWGAFRRGPFTPLDGLSLATVTRELPPLYQITEVRP